MDYYYVFPNACCDFDEQTILKDIKTYSITAENVGLIFDFWPLDDLISCHPERICTERLKYLIEMNHEKFSGIEEFIEIKRISTAANWNANFPGARPGHYWHMKINGEALKDDFANFSEKRYLVISKRALAFLLKNHVSEILGEKIEGDIDVFFAEYEKRLIASKYMGLPPKISKMDFF